MIGWSRWVFVITPGAGRPSLDDVKVNAGIFARARFGASALVHITTYVDRTFTFDIRAEGQPVLDPAYVTRMTAAWQQWARLGWGAWTEVRCVLAIVADEPRRTGATATGRATA